MCQRGLKISRVQGQRRVRGAVGAFGAGRQIPRRAPEAAPGLEAVCEVPACGAGQLLGRGGGDTGLAPVSGGQHDFPLGVHQWGAVRLSSLNA